MWYQTKATEILGIQYPILLGPFGGGLSSVEQVAMVSNMGGLGGYGAYTLSPQEIYEVHRQIRATTAKPYNLNLWVSDTDAVNGTVMPEAFAQAAALFQPYYEEAGIDLPAQVPVFNTRFENQLQAVLDIRPDVFSFMFGTLPADVMEECRKRGIKLLGVATTPDEAIALEATGVDMIVASGFEAGGHRPSFLAPAEQSTMGTFVLLQLLREQVKVPVIAAGGIADGRGIAAALTLGAAAVQVGTAFFACDESAALPEHRAALFSDRAKHTMLTRAFTGRLGRGIHTPLALELAGKENQFLPFPLQTALSGPLRKAALAQQQYDAVMFWSGQVAPVLQHRKTETLMQALIEAAGQLLPLRP